MLRKKNDRGKAHTKLRMQPVWLQMKYSLILTLLLFLIIGCSNQTINDQITDTRDSSGVTKYLKFEQDSYDQSLAEGKIVLLDFYANWCPICRSENPKLRAGLNELNNPNVIAYLVHYNDNEVTLEEETLAEKYGITYQHTKIILKNNEVVLKSLESWNKEKTLEELRKVI